tara:strand:+ start:758 stop:2197 length:1440 start_codon:yes stop_codon:yes gene_type:complete
MAKPIQVKAGPTKAFFVRMLTRDIDLADAILDLLDNCVDGIVRSMNDSDSRAGRSGNGKPYDGFWAKIIAKPDCFEIWDNCGGIPQDIAEEYAFMLGRPDLKRDADVETVGMYGIGMKRAVFKMGERCVVTSQPESGQYKVEITPEWLQEDSNWNLELSKTPKTQKFKENGTKIVVTELHKGIRHQFQKSATFLEDLGKEIERHYALLLEKGFRVSLNGTKINPVELSVLTPKINKRDKSPQIEPYIFVGEFDDVQVELTVGFYRPLIKEQELEESLLKSTRDHAGWTIICNERVVLYNDKTPKTGWGTRGVPSFHNQFISIAGVVSFRSKNSMKLPLNTTKRGIDTSSDVYHIVLEFMQDGLKKFTSFTNDWKRREDQTKKDFDSLVSRKPTELLKAVDKSKLNSIRRFKDKGSGQFYSPNLPKPVEKERQARLCFLADKAEIALISEYYFGNSTTDRSDVGRRCFDESLIRAKEAGE